MSESERKNLVALAELRRQTDWSVGKCYRAAQKVPGLAYRGGTGRFLFDVEVARRASHLEPVVPAVGDGRD